MRYKQALYQDWKDGEITRNDYRHMSEDYERQAEALNNVLRTLTDEQEQLENGVDCGKSFPGRVSQVSEHRQADTGNSGRAH